MRNSQYFVGIFIGVSSAATAFYRVEVSGFLTENAEAIGSVSAIVLAVVAIVTLMRTTSKKV